MEALILKIKTDQGAQKNIQKKKIKSLKKKLCTTRHTIRSLSREENIPRSSLRDIIFREQKENNPIQIRSIRKKILLDASDKKKRKTFCNYHFHTNWKVTIFVKVFLE